MSRHDTLRATWQHGQYWETKLDECPVWVAVGGGGYAQPLWDEHQEYRRNPEQEHRPCDDAEARRLWIEAGMPPYLLSKPGTNYGLVRFLELARAQPATPKPDRDRQLAGPEASLDQVMEAVAETHAGEQPKEE